MTAEPLQNHTCGYYCADGHHAVECVARPEATREAIWQGYDRYLASHGWQVVGVRPAPEADTVAWAAVMDWGYTPGSQQFTRYQEDPIDGPLAAWLILIAPQEETL